MTKDAMRTLKRNRERLKKECRHTLHVLNALVKKVYEDEESCFCFLDLYPHGKKEKYLVFIRNGKITWMTSQLTLSLLFIVYGQIATPAAGEILMAAHDEKHIGSVRTFDCISKFLFLSDVPYPMDDNTVMVCGGSTVILYYNDEYQEYVTEEMLRDWGVTYQDAAAAAMKNSGQNAFHTSGWMYTGTETAYMAECPEVRHGQWLS